MVGALEFFVRGGGVSPCGLGMYGFWSRDLVVRVKGSNVRHVSNQ